MRKNKYSPELRIQIAREYLSGQSSLSSLEKQYGIDHGMIEQWIKQYEAKGASTFFTNGKNNIYEANLKERAVKDYLEGKGSLRDVTARYGIRDKITLRQWISRSILETPPFGDPSIEYYAEDFHRKMIFQAAEQIFGIVFSSA